LLLIKTIDALLSQGFLIALLLDFKNYLPFFGKYCSFAGKPNIKADEALNTILY